MRVPRRRTLLPRICATVVVAAGLSTVTTAVTTAAAPSASAADADVRINEVESNGDTQDWIELTNIGAAPVDLSGWRLSDNSASEIAIASGTVLQPGSFLAFDTDVTGVPGQFGLGGGDTAEVFTPTGTTPVDTYSWTAHATTTYGRCPNGTGAFVTTKAGTKGAANSCPSPYDGLRINEVESNGGTPGDWIELKNTTAATIDISGVKVRDNDATHTPYAFPAGTTIAAGAYVLVEEAQLGFGLGAADSAVVLQPDGTTLIEQYDWTAHAGVTYGRCPDGTGAFANTAASTKGAANSCQVVSTDYSAIKVNEVESNGGTPGDWVELKNTGTSAVDIGGIRFRDNDTTHVQYAVPAGTTIAAGGYYLLEEAQFGFGLGSADSATVWQPDGTTVIDQYSWTAHAAITYGRCPDGTGPFADNFSSSKGAANDCFPVKINEIESSGGTPGDWVELRNNGAATVDVSGLILKDNVDTDVYTIPAGTTITSGGYLVLEEAQFVFGLGGGDSARLFAADGTTLLDSYTWTTHASTTYGRCPDGVGAFATTQQPTKGAANLCPGDLVTVPWPGGADVTTVDPQNTFASNMSGLMYEPSGTSAAGSLWAVRNGPGALFKLTRTGSTWAPAADFATAGKLLHYKDGTGDVDAEGVTFTSAGPAAGVFVASERNNAVSGTSRPAILRFDPTSGTSDLTATNDWNLTADLPGLGANLGLEAIAWVPDSYLTAKGFVDANTSAAYDPASYPHHGTGLFLVGVEQTGNVHAYALDLTSDSYTRVATFASGFPSVMELSFEVETQKLWVVCDDGCQGRSSRFDVNASGAFAPTAYYERPATMANLNNEGFTLAPRAECVGGTKPVFWSDDSSTGGYAIRQGTVTCTPRVAQTVTFTSTAPTSATVGGTYTVAATGGASGNPVTFATTTPTVCTVAGSTVTFDHGGTCTVRASQAGDADRLDGTATQSVSVARLAQSVAFTSTPPTSPVVGQTYTVAATGGASGNPVTFSTLTAACTISGSTVTIVAPGTCQVLASQAGNGDYQADGVSQLVTAVKATTATAVEVGPDDITATVSVIAPGAAPTTGVVTFTVDGVAAGSALVEDGVATVSYAVPTGATRTVAASYTGTDLLAGSSGSVDRRDPLITAALTSTVPQSAAGWWSAPVTVTFTCTAQGSAIGDCPAPVVLSSSGAGQSVTAEVAAADGGVGRVVVDLVDIDLVAPTVRVGGIRDGATYPLDAPAPTCISADPLSGVASCRLSSTTAGLVTTVTAVATDAAGNTSRATARWRRPVVRVQGALRVLADGTYVVERGSAYRLTALLGASPQPRALTPVTASKRFATPGVPMKRGGAAGALTTWGRTIRVTGPGRDHKVAVQVGSRRIVVDLRVV